MAASFSQSNLGIQSAGSTTINVANGIAIPNANQTLKMAYNQGTGSAQVVGTVTTGKTAYIYAVVIWSGSNGSGVVYQNDGATALLNVGVLANTCAVVTAGGMPFHTYGSAVQIKASMPATHYYSVFWVEQ